jgi:tetratricopeptide (TPR) repeat protein
LRYGWLLLVKQKIDEGSTQLRLAQEYDPLSPATNKALCNVLTLQRKFDEAIYYCGKAFEISPDTPGVRESLANAYFVGGKYEKAVAQIRKEIEVNGETDYLRGILAFYYAKMGRRAEAENFYDKLKQTTEKNAPMLADLTLTAFTLGRKDEALEHFKELIKTPNPFPEFEFTLNYDPIWDGVRSDQQFAPLFPK